MPIGPATGGGAVGSAATDATSDRDPDDQAHPADRVIRADLRGSSQVIGRRGAIEIDLERLGVADDPEGPLPCGDRRLVAECHGDVAPGPVGAVDGEDDRVAGVLARRPRG